ncbi:MAG: hypothetical protein ACR2NG_05500 [Acidimicrobiia bacterium]
MAESTRSLNARRAGYGIAALFNAVLLVIVNNVLAWGWFSWLTDDFELILPLINLSLLATILVNLAYMAYDAAWLKSLCEIGLLAISITVAVRTFRVFPFDFSAYSWDWDATVKLAITCAIIGMSIAIVVHTVKLIMALVQMGQTHQPSH